MTESSTDPAARDRCSNSTGSTISTSADSASTGRPNVVPRAASTCRSFSAEACVKRVRYRGGSIEAARGAGGEFLGGCWHYWLGL